MQLREWSMGRQAAAQASRRELSPMAPPVAAVGVEDARARAAALRTTAQAQVVEVVLVAAAAVMPAAAAAIEAANLEAVMDDVPVAVHAKLGQTG